jgi:hypothetical protein
VWLYMRDTVRQDWGEDYSEGVGGERVAFETLGYSSASGRCGSRGMRWIGQPRASYIAGRGSGSVISLAACDTALSAATTFIGLRGRPCGQKKIRPPSRKPIIRHIVCGHNVKQS